MPSTVFSSPLFLVLSLATGTVHAQSPEPPVGGEELRKWLESGHYKSWKSESRIHESSGPHFGRVRAFLNPVLFDSMGTKNAEHPQGAVAVKELFGDTDALSGWAVSIKTAADSASGLNWYWYEFFGGRTVRDQQGEPLCAGCHRVGHDYILTHWPLQ